MLGVGRCATYQGFHSLDELYSLTDFAIFPPAALMRRFSYSADGLWSRLMSIALVVQVRVSVSVGVSFRAKVSV
jgi:hypothetical protein